MKHKPRGRSRTIMLASKPRTCDECGEALSVPYVRGVVKRCSVCEVRYIALMSKGKAA